MKCTHLILDAACIIFSTVCCRLTLIKPNNYTTCFLNHLYHSCNTSFEIMILKVVFCVIWDPPSGRMANQIAYLLDTNDFLNNCTEDSNFLSNLDREIELDRQCSLASPNGRIAIQTNCLYNNNDLLNSLIEDSNFLSHRDRETELVGYAHFYIGTRQSITLRTL